MKPKIISQSGKKRTIQFEFEIGSSMLENEKKFQEVLNEVGVLASGEILAQFDTDGEPIVFGGHTMTSKGRIECAYQTPYGEVNVARHVYQSSKGGKTYCPLENSARIIGSATPLFAKQISSKYADFGSLRVAKDLIENHGRQVAKGYVQNVADFVGAIALEKEEDWTYKTPAQDVPVSTVSIGIDGTCMLTIEDGWRQAMVGTVALYSAAGERLHTIYVGATPEYGKETFLERMQREVDNTRGLFPTAIFVAVADGAKDNWPFLKRNSDRQCLDFFHATEYLTKAADAAFYKDKLKRNQWLEDACHRLKHNKSGPTALIKEMESFKNKHIGEERKAALDAAITYFRNQKKLMKYAEHVEESLPIGSGVTEAACKVIVKQRLCNSGMRWKEQGAATVLSLRTLNYSEGRWNQFWQKIDVRGFQLAA